MLVVIFRDGKELSVKASFIVQLIKSSSRSTLLYVFRKEKNHFREKLSYNKIELATSLSGILLFFSILYFLKNPKDLHDEIIRWFSKKKRVSFIRNNGFLTILSLSLYQYLARSARADGMLNFLGKLDVQKVFLIDEFYSLNVVSLRKLKSSGSIIYISSDLAYDFFGENYVASRLMYKFELDSITLPDLIIACSERDKLKYLEMGAKKVVYYPNIYPIHEFKRCDKDQIPSISVVLRGHWGSRTYKSLKQLFKALAYIDKPIKVYTIGTKPKNVPKNVELHNYNYIPSKLDYLELLSKSWIGINFGIHAGGTNQRKYDYALAGLVVISDSLGARGDLLPNEYTYIDTPDLASKLLQLLDLGKQKIIEKGTENHKYALSLAKKQREVLEKMITETFF